VRRGKKRRIGKVPAWIAAALLAGAAAVSLAPLLAPALSQAALFSAVLAMPEGAFSALLSGLKEGGGAPLEAVSPLPGQGERKPEVSSVPSPESGEEPDLRTGGLPEGAKPLPYIAPDIPEEYRRPVLQEDFSGAATRAAIPIGNYWLRNDTELAREEIERLLQAPRIPALSDTAEPQVLIYHTHATESFAPYDSDSYDNRYNWRSTDNNNNMVAVGAVMARVLRSQGIGVVHDTSQHDYPSYNGSYANSYRSIKRYLEQYPTIKVVLDLHRDAIEREGGLIVKPTAEIGGEKYAQLMIVSNCDDGTGLLPNWRENLRFAGAFCARIEREYPGLTRPILFSYRKYNQQLSTGALLLEFGSHASTLEEAKRTAEAAGSALAGLLLEGKSNP